ncbi:TetR/AcrR family transcriptional regulator [Bacteroidota bacterium]
MEEKGNIKFQQIVSTGKSLFWKFGINRVSIEEICREANVSKMTFYKHFRNKTELIKFILKKLTDEAWEKYYAIMKQNIPYNEKIKQTIELKMRGTSDLSSEFYIDFYKHADPELRNFLQELSNESLKKVKEDYLKAQKEGNIRQDINLDFIYYFLNQIFFNLAKDDYLINLYPNPGDLIYELINFFFYGIMPRNNETK